MAFDAGAVVGRLVLDKTDFDKTADQAISKMQNLGREFITTGRQLGRLGSAFIMFGGVAITPFTLMIKSAAKENVVLEGKLNNLTSSFTKLRDELVVYITPHVDELVNLVKSLAKGFDELSPRVKKTTVDFIIYGSALLIVTGTMLQFVKFLTTITGALLIVGSHIAKLIPLMAIFSTFRMMGLQTDIAILAANAGIAYPALMLIGTAFASWKLGSYIADIKGVSDALSGPDGLFTKMFLWLDKQDILGKMEKFLKMLPGYKAGLAAGANFSAPSLGGGDYEKIAVQKTVSWIDLAKVKMTDFTNGFNLQLRESIDELANWGKFGKQVATDMIASMQQVTSDFFFNVFHGQIKSAMDAFKQFGDFVLRVISDIIAKFITLKIIGAVVGLGSGALASTTPSTHLPAYQPLSTGFAEGTDSVPYTGIYKLHEGEKVTPKYDATKDTTQPITIYNVIAPEAVAAAMSGKEGSGVIINVINQNSLRNGVMRREVKRR